MEIDEYHNLPHKYYILVPHDEAACDSLYNYDIYGEDGEISNKFSSMTFYEDTYYRVEKRLFWAFNDEFDVYISLYEEDVIENKNLDRAVEIIRDVIDEEKDSFVKGFALELLKMFETAKEHNTIVGFCF